MKSGRSSNDSRRKKGNARRKSSAKPKRLKNRDWKSSSRKNGRKLSCLSKKRYRKNRLLFYLKTKSEKMNEIVKKRRKKLSNCRLNVLLNFKESKNELKSSVKARQMVTNRNK